MKWVLNSVYLLLLTLLSPMIAWRALRHGRYRRGWREKLFGQLQPVADRRQPVVWFHAVSVGEILHLQKVVDAFRRMTGEQFHIVVTSSTDTGFELAESRFPDCSVSWFPLDFSWAVDAAIRRVNPAMVVLMELELWPNFLLSCRRHSVATALINARMSDRSFAGYRRLNHFIRPLFHHFTVVAAQTEEYAARLIQLGTPQDQTHVTGSVKFDGVLSNRDNSATGKLRELFQIQDSDLILIAGSTQHPEEQLAVNAWQQLRQHHPALRLIIVPRHRERFDEVAGLIQQSQCRVLRRSALTPGAEVSADAVILLDTIGELSACWGLADIAFVGGSFGSRGGQNMLEPAAFGAAVLFGPNTSNFRDIVSRLLTIDGAIRLTEEADLATCVESLLNDPPRRRQLGLAARNMVLSQQGALMKTTKLLTAAAHDAAGQPTTRAADRAAA
ncbi:MAG: 3-deoxy-D-manno-octulosonic acid transferase [Fuerstiella sp.]